MTPYTTNEVSLVEFYNLLLLKVLVSFVIRFFNAAAESCKAVNLKG